MVWLLIGAVAVAWLWATVYAAAHAPPEIRSVPVLLLAAVLFPAFFIVGHAVIGVMWLVSPSWREWLRNEKRQGR